MVLKKMPQPANCNKELSRLIEIVAILNNEVKWEFKKGGMRNFALKLSIEKEGKKT